MSSTYHRQHSIEKHAHRTSTMTTALRLDSDNSHDEHRNVLCTGVTHVHRYIKLLSPTGNKEAGSFMNRSSRPRLLSEDAMATTRLSRTHPGYA